MGITIKDLSFKYRGSKHQVLDNVTIDVKQNCICGLLGKNGVGKSTLLYLIAGLLRGEKGEISVDGFNPKNADPEMLREIFFVPEEFSLPNISLREYVKINAQFYPRFSEDTMKECLREFEMPEEVKLGELSMGQKKKVFMSFALATGTNILLMDEPTNGLDIPSKAQFRKVLSRTMTDDRIVVISTHQVHDVEQLLDHVIILSQEGVLLDKSTAEIADEYVFENRMPNDMDDVIYAEPSLQGNSVVAKRGDRPETPINLELLFNAFHNK